ncbi:hypothetical protein ACQJBY_047217 [Aegilops geniculata]
MSSARSPSAAPEPLDDDDLLPEILLRLPPQPSSLPGASLVSKRWRSLASDPAFLRRFRRHHRRNPPLLGFFRVELRDRFEPRFQPSLDAPNRIPPERLSWRWNEGDDCYDLVGCRHGLVLVLNRAHTQVLVWDPATGDRRRVAVPPGFKIAGAPISGTVLRGAGDGDHFQVVLVGTDGEEGQITEAIAYIYSSETGAWGDPISTPLPSKHAMVSVNKTAVMVGDFIYWLLKSDEILEFDLDRKRLSLIPVPADLDLGSGSFFFSVIRADGGGLGFLFLSGFNAQLWKRKTDSDGVTSWVLDKTIEIDRLLPPEDVEARRSLMILAYAEDNDTALMWTGLGLRGRIFTMQLKSLKFEELLRNTTFGYFYLFESVYAAETGIGGGAGLLHNT